MITPADIQRIKDLLPTTLGSEYWFFTRIHTRRVPRTDWPQRWRAAAVSVHYQGVLDGPLLIARKDSPIWRALGQGVGGFEDATGNDHPPFAFNSGMGWLPIKF